MSETDTIRSEVSEVIEVSEILEVREVLEISESEDVSSSGEGGPPSIVIVQVKTKTGFNLVFKILYSNDIVVDAA